jgi:hypothetical protein
MRIAGIIAALAITAGIAAGLAAPSIAQTRPMTLQPDRLPGMCISMSGPGGSSISIPCDGSTREKFVLPPAEGGPIQYGDKCLVPKGQGYYPPLFAETCDGSPEQAWTMNEERELRSAAGRCISLLGASSRTGEMVFAGECPKVGAAHQWKPTYVDFTNVVYGSFESKARPGMCIGYDRDLELLPCTDAYRQVISFDEKALGQFRMMSSCISGGYAFGGLSLGECWDMPQQKWMKLSGDRLANQQVMCIEVSPENGRDVLRTGKCGQQLEQQWIFRPAPEKW